MHRGTPHPRSGPPASGASPAIRASPGHPSIPRPSEHTPARRHRRSPLPPPEPLPGHSRWHRAGPSRGMLLAGRGAGGSGAAAPPVLGTGGRRAVSSRFAPGCGATGPSPDQQCVSERPAAAAPVRGSPAPCPCHRTRRCHHRAPAPAPALSLPAAQRGKPGCKVGTAGQAGLQGGHSGAGPARLPHGRAPACPASPLRPAASLPQQCLPGEAPAAAALLQHRPQFGALLPQSCWLRCFCAPTGCG